LKDAVDFLHKQDAQLYQNLLHSKTWRIDWL